MAKETPRPFPDATPSFSLEGPERKDLADVAGPDGHVLGLEPGQTHEAEAAFDGLIVVTRGRGTIRIAGAARILSTGDVALIAAGQTWSAVADGGERLGLLVVDREPAAATAAPPRAPTLVEPEFGPGPEPQPEPPTLEESSPVPRPKLPGLVLPEIAAGPEPATLEETTSVRRPKPATLEHGPRSGKAEESHPIIDTPLHSAPSTVTRGAASEPAALPETSAQAPEASGTPMKSPPSPEETPSVKRPEPATLEPEPRAPKAEKSPPIIATPLHSAPSIVVRGSMSEPADLPESSAKTRSPLAATDEEIPGTAIDGKVIDTVDDRIVFRADDLSEPIHLLPTPAEAARHGPGPIRIVVEASSRSFNRTMGTARAVQTMGGEPIRFTGIVQRILRDRGVLVVDVGYPIVARNLSGRTTDSLAPGSGVMFQAVGPTRAIVLSRAP